MSLCDARYLSIVFVGGGGVLRNENPINCLSPSPLNLSAEEAVNLTSAVPVQAVKCEQFGRFLESFGPLTIKGIKQVELPSL